MFIVLLDDDCTICIPMTSDERCEGSLATWSLGDRVELFASRKDARTAINISAKFAALCKLQGKDVNLDFAGPTYKKWIKIVEVKLFDPSKPKEPARE